MNNLSKTHLNPQQQAALESSFGDQVCFNCPIAPFTTINIGGPADILLVARTAYELGRMVTSCWEMGLPTSILGNGSNVLISDKGIRAAVIINHATAIQVIEDPSHPGQMTRIFAESGALLGKVSRIAAEHSLASFEWAEGIPGTIGGAVIGNAGAFGGELAENFVSAEILQRGQQERTYLPADMGFAYRTSLFKQSRIECVVLSAVFQLQPGIKTEILQRMQQNAEKRRSKQPSARSIGSVFKNPKDEFAGRLINQLNLKGTRIGDVMISQEHANIFINVGQATAGEFRAMMDFVRSKVFEAYGITLEPEILFLGEW